MSPGEGTTTGSPSVADPGDDHDRALLQAHVDGDPHAFGELARRHRDRLWAVAMRTLRNPEDAADAVQDALISAMRKASSYRGEAAVFSWLRRVVVNACLDRLRRERVRPKIPLGELEVASGTDDHSDLEIRIDVHAALTRLPEAQRAAIVLVDLLGWSVAEAAAELGVADGTVKSRCSRGRAQLAKILSGRQSGGVPVERRGPLEEPRNHRVHPHVAGADAWTTGLPGPATSGGGS